MGCRRALAGPKKRDRSHALISASQITDNKVTREDAPEICTQITDRRIRLRFEQITESRSQNGVCFHHPCGGRCGGDEALACGAVEMKPAKCRRASTSGGLRAPEVCSNRSARRACGPSGAGSRESPGVLGVLLPKSMLPKLGFADVDRRVWEATIGLGR